LRAAEVPLWGRSPARRALVKDVADYYGEANINKNKSLDVALQSTLTTIYLTLEARGGQE